MNQNESNNESSSGINLIGLLTIAFIILKLLKVINWSWWWVLSPIWLSVGIVSIICFVVFIYSLIEISIEEKRERENK